MAGIGEPSITPEEYRHFAGFLEESTGILLGERKEYLVSSRLASLMRERCFRSYSELVQSLVAGRDAQLRIEVINAMTTNETFWFRDMAHFQVLPKLAAESLGNQRSGLRIWSAACSTGQEPYTIAMVLSDLLLKGAPSGVEILATDLSSRALEEAKRGVYCGLSVSRGLDDGFRSKYFRAANDCLEVLPEIRRLIRFQQLNLTQDFAHLGRFDIVFCRNVLIYFSASLKRLIIQRLAAVLKPGGYLLLGSTESLHGIALGFEMLTIPGGIIYRRSQDIGTPRTLPRPPISGPDKAP